MSQFGCPPDSGRVCAGSNRTSYKKGWFRGRALTDETCHSLAAAAGGEGERE